MLLIYEKLKTEPIQYRCEFVACIFQNLGSYLYLIGALLSFDKTRLIKKILLFNFIGIVFFLIDSIFTLIGWIITFRRKPSNNPKNGCTIQVKNNKVNDKFCSLFFYIECLYMGTYFKYYC